MDNQDKIFNKIKSAAQKAEHQDFPGMEKVWSRVEEKLEQKELQSKTQLWKKVAIAASLLLFVSLGYQFLKNDAKNDAIIESSTVKVAVQKEEPTKDSIVPSEIIKTEAPEILQKQLQKPNPVAIVENPTSKSKDQLIVADKKAEETTIKADGIISSESNNTYGAAPAAMVKAKSLAPANNYLNVKEETQLAKSNETTISEYQKSAKMAAVKTSLTTRITGILTDEKDNLPIPGATVQIAGKDKGVVTDFDGKYSIDVQKGEKLIFNMIGYNSREAIVNNSDKMNAKLTPSSDALNEVVVVGYGTARKKQGKNAEPIAKYGTTKFYKSKKEISVPHIKEALYIINEEEYSETSLFGPNPTNPYAPISEQKIESVQVLSKKEAISKYGEKGKNKVIIITTKNGIPLKR